MGKLRLSTLWIRYERRRPVDILRWRNNSPWLTPNPQGSTPCNSLPMKIIYTLLVIACFLLAMAVSSGKLGGISDSEAFRRASLKY